MSLVAASSGWRMPWRARNKARVRGRRRAISMELKRSFMRAREASQKGVSGLREASRKPGKSWSTKAWMRLEVAVC